MVEAAGFRYIPKGAIKVADKNSDAVAYFYNSEINGREFPAVRVFFGKQSKPVLRCYFTKFGDKTGEQQRAQRVAELFRDRQAVAVYRAKRRADRQAQTRGVEVGQFLKASWGYDQTNVDFYQVTKLIGETMAEVQKVPNISTGNDGNMSGKVIPGENDGKGKTYRVKVKAGGATINNNYASIWDGTPAYTSWYA
jgi:hypothetical protein